MTDNDDECSMQEIVTQSVNPLLVHAKAAGVSRRRRGRRRMMRMNEKYRNREMDEVPKNFVLWTSLPRTSPLVYDLRIMRKVETLFRDME